MLNEQEDQFAIPDGCEAVGNQHDRVKMRRQSIAYPDSIATAGRVKALHPKRQTMRVSGDTKAGQLYDAAPTNDTLARTFRPSRFNSNTTGSRPDISRYKSSRSASGPSETLTASPAAGPQCLSA